MKNKANSKLLFLYRNLKGFPEMIKQTAYFSLIHSVMLWSMAPLFGTRTRSTTVIRLRGCSIELQDSSKVGIQDTLSVSYMLDEETGGLTYSVLQNY